MNGAPPLSLPGFYSQLIQQIGLWVIITIIFIAIIWVIKNHFSKLSPKLLTLFSTPDHIRAKDFLRLSLAAFWILDGVLQAQPAMAGSFPSHVIGSVSNSQPFWLEYILRWETYLWQLHPRSFDIATVMIQVGLGIIILGTNNSSQAKFGLWLSIAWSSLVWVGGEALGGLLAPGASVIFGSPGAALFYAIAAAILMMPNDIWYTNKASNLIRYLVGGLFIFGSVLEVVPSERLWSPKYLSNMFATMANTPQPSFLSSPMADVAHWSSQAPFAWNASISVIMLILGLGLIFGKNVNGWLLGTGIFLIIQWWIGQDFGVLGGTGTDPNLAAIILIFLITAKLSYSANLVKQKNPIDKKITIAFPWRLLAIIGGLTSIAVGILPPITSLPSAVGKPLALHVSPPPLPKGVTIPLATLAGQINISLLASSQRLQVSLITPHGQSSNLDSKFFLTGIWKSPAGKVKKLPWLSCGSGCFVTNIAWSKGINKVTLHPQASGWKGAVVSFNIPWPGQLEPQLLHKVLITMGHINSIMTTQSVTSNTKGPSFPSLQISVSGPQLLSGEPYGLKPPAQAVLLSRSPDTATLGLAYPHSNIYVQLVVNKQNRIIREQLTSPHHLIEARFQYPK